MEAYLMLEDGSVYAGTAHGDFKETAFEVVCNTSMTGYVELLTDPSYLGQGVVMTYPIIGNYGVNKADFESDTLQPRALIVHELCDTPSNFRCTGTIDDLLCEYHIPCLSGIDTRAVVKKLRENGTMRGVVTADISDKDRLLSVMQNFEQNNLVESVTARETTVLGENNTGAKIALLDFGTTRNIVNSLTQRDCVVTKYPAQTAAQEILRSAPDGILLSNGPGNPAECVNIIKEIKTLYASGIPMFGIGLGHQLLALANGGKTEKMKYGHRGANYPVKFLQEDRTYITAQNHGYTVCDEGLPENAEITCINVNDKTVEGLRYHDQPVFTVQFQPEADSGPGGTSFLYDRFLNMVKEGQHDA